MKILATIALLFALLIAKWFPWIATIILLVVGLLYIDETAP